MPKSHGMSRTRIYFVWKNMNQRCANKSRTDWMRYGGRGIKVCSEWRESFESFMRDMGDPGPGFQIDRIDNGGNYEPDNCRWVTSKENCNNRRSNRLITANGETLTLAQWSERTGLCVTSIQRRMSKGLTGDRAVTPQRDSARGERQGNSKLTADKVREIKRLHAAGGLSKTKIGHMFGVSESSVHQIVIGTSWKHVA